MPCIRTMHNQLMLLLVQAEPDQAEQADQRSGEIAKLRATIACMDTALG